MFSGCTIATGPKQSLWKRRGLVHATIYTGNSGVLLNKQAKRYPNSVTLLHIVIYTQFFELHNVGLSKGWFIIKL